MVSAIAIGDSITRSGGAQVQADVEPLSWAQLVARALGWQLETRAQSGASTREIIGLIPAGRYAHAFVCAGTNDVLSARNWSQGRFSSDFTELLDRVGAISPSIIILGLTPNVGSLPAPFAYGWGLRGRIEAGNAVIESAGRSRSATVVMPPRLQRPVEMYGDCVHPTSIGHVRLANATLAAMGKDVRIDVQPAPTDAYLARARARMRQDVLKRPPRGLAASVVGMVKR